MLHRSELAPEPFQTHCEIIRYSYTGRLRCPIKRPKAAAPELFERQNCLGRRIKYCFEFKVYIKRSFPVCSVPYPNGPLSVEQK